MNITQYEFHGNPVRTTVENEQVWFCGRDICEQLEYTNPHKALADHCRGVTKRYPLQTAGGIQEAVFISEPDVWRLICSSQQPRAIELERWIFEEVLPAIRRTGGYSVQTQTVTLDEMVAALAQRCPEQVTITIKIGGRKPPVRPKVKAWDMPGTPTLLDLADSKMQNASHFIMETVQEECGSRLMTRELYQKYFQWCTSQGLHPLCSRTFMRQVRSLFPNVARVRYRVDRERENIYDGLAYR